MICLKVLNKPQGVWTWTHTCTCMLACTRTRLHARARTHARLHARARTRARLHARARTRTHTHTRTHACIILAPKILDHCRGGYFNAKRICGQILLYYSACWPLMAQRPSQGPQTTSARHDRLMIIDRDLSIPA